MNKLYNQNLLLENIWVNMRHQIHTLHHNDELMHHFVWHNSVISSMKKIKGALTLLEINKQTTLKLHASTMKRKEQTGECIPRYAAIDRQLAGYSWNATDPRHGSVRDDLELTTTPH